MFHIHKNKGFTLIELLIVVAIIAILAAIAIPNYLNASVRAKVSRVMEEERTLATGMESYLVDNNCYPSCCICAMLTTPVSYLTTVPNDPFVQGMPMPYMTTRCMGMQAFCINSVGPDGWTDWMPDMWMCCDPMTYPTNYDPTNGTVSNGDIFRNTQGD